MFRKSTPITRQFLSINGHGSWADKFSFLVAVIFLGQCLLGCGKNGNPSEVNILANKSPNDFNIETQANTKSNIPIWISPAGRHFYALDMDIIDSGIGETELSYAQAHGMCRRLGLNLPDFGDFEYDKSRTTPATTFLNFVEDSHDDQLTKKLRQGVWTLASFTPQQQKIFSFYLQVYHNPETGEEVGQSPSYQASSPSMSHGFFCVGPAARKYFKSDPARSCGMMTGLSVDERINDCHERPIDLDSLNGQTLKLVARAPSTPKHLNAPEYWLDEATRTIWGPIQTEKRTHPAASNHCKELADLGLKWALPAENDYKLVGYFNNQPGKYDYISDNPAIPNLPFIKGKTWIAGEYTVFQYSPDDMFESLNPPTWDRSRLPSAPYRCVSTKAHQ